MSTTSALPSSQAAAQLARWLGYLQQGPDNLNLLQQAASGAFDAGQSTLCQSLLDRCSARGPLPPSMINLQALLWLSQGDFTKALDQFALLDDQLRDPVLRFNMAYAQAMLGQHEAAASLLDATVLDAVPTAVTLTVRVAHHQGALDRAMQCAELYIHRPDADAELPGALASVYFDAERPDLARKLALLAPDAPDSLTVIGMLALLDGAQDEAEAHFLQALAASPSSGRALLGAGLCEFARQDFARAAATLDSAAASLKRHAGTWVAAAWAHLYKSDLATARARFEHATTIDRGFAEPFGGLAVIAVREKRLKEANGLIKTAMRLDRHCLAATLASSMLAAETGDRSKSAEIVQQALGRPFGIDGTTLGKLIINKAIRSGNPIK